MDATSVFMNQEMDTSNSLENMLVCSQSSQQDHQKKLLQKPQQDQQQQQKCPRCDSTNTKFCYYNNYSLTQPRYFCKSCKRYWTKGGALRNIPVGGGCRKNHRPSSSSSSSSSLAKRVNIHQDHYNHQPHMINTHYNNVDLSLECLELSMLQKQSIGQLGFHHDNNYINQLSILGNPRNNDFFGNFENMYYGGGISNNGSNIGVEIMENSNIPYWQIGGSDSTNVSTSWHGFLNSPLM